jgi:hypothetical protein
MCEHHDHENIDPMEIIEGMSEEHRTEMVAGSSLVLLASLCDHYIDEGVADPTMFQALEIAEKLAKIFGSSQVADILAITKMRAGDLIDKQIAERKDELDDTFLAQLQKMGFGLNA